MSHSVHIPFVSTKLYSTQRYFEIKSSCRLDLCTNRVIIGLFVNSKSLYWFFIFLCLFLSLYFDRFILQFQPTVARKCHHTCSLVSSVLVCRPKLRCALWRSGSVYRGSKLYRHVHSSAHPIHFRHFCCMIIDVSFSHKAPKSWLQTIADFCLKLQISKYSCLRRL